MNETLDQMIASASGCAAGAAPNSNFKLRH